jgi:hypothetical protein
MTAKNNTDAMTRICFPLVLVEKTEFSAYREVVTKRLPLLSIGFQTPTISGMGSTGDRGRGKRKGLRKMLEYWGKGRKDGEKIIREY